MRDIERNVLGCDYGGTSWTTSDQARQMIEMLQLEPGVNLIDIGAGSGWPGLLVAVESGCDVTLVDLPMNALQKARERACDDGIDDRVNTTVASGAELPFKNGVFRALSHSDVLCCMHEKIEMLGECRRIASDDAKMLFSVIAIAQNLSGADRYKAVVAGPPFVDAPSDYAEMLARSGWHLVQRINVTAVHRKSLIALINGLQESTELANVLGHENVQEAISYRREQIAVIDAGLLVREIFFCSAI